MVQATGWFEKERGLKEKEEPDTITVPYSRKASPGGTSSASLQRLDQDDGPLVLIDVHLVIWQGLFPSLSTIFFLFYVLVSFTFLFTLISSLSALFCRTTARILPSSYLPCYKLVASLEPLRIPASSVCFWQPWNTKSMQSMRSRERRVWHILRLVLSVGYTRTFL